METLFEGYDSHDEYLESIQCVGELFRKRRPYSAAAKEGEQSGKKGKTMFGKKCLWYYLITIESVKGAEGCAPRAYSKDYGRESYLSSC